MNRRKRLSEAGMILALIGCAACEEEMPLENELTDAPVDEVYESMKMEFNYDTVDEGKIKLAVTEDNMVVISTEQHEEGFNGMSIDLSADIDLVDMYKKLTWEKEAPERLTEINQVFLNNLRSREALKTQPDNTQFEAVETDVLADNIPIPTAQHYTPQYLFPDDWVEEPPKNPIRDPMSRNYFHSRYCNYSSEPGAFNHVDFGRCWLDQTGNTSWQHDHISDMVTWAYFKWGQGYHKIRRKKLGQWSTIECHGVQTGVISGIRLFAETTSNSEHYTIKGEVWDGVGDTYHLTIFGWF